MSRKSSAGNTKRNPAVRRRAWNGRPFQNRRLCMRLLSPMARICAQGHRCRAILLLLQGVIDVCARLIQRFLLVVALQDDAFHRSMHRISNLDELR